MPKRVGASFGLFLLISAFLPGCTLINDLVGLNRIKGDIKEISGIVLPDTDPAKIIITSDKRIILSDLIVLVFEEGVRQEVKEGVIGSVGGKLAGQIPQINTYYVRLSRSQTEHEIDQLIQKLNREPSVKRALPEEVLLFQVESSLSETTDIENLAAQDKKWGFTQIQVPEAWSLLREKGVDLSDEVEVGVIDSGFDLNHEDLKENFITTLNGHPAYDFGERDFDVAPDRVDPKYRNHGTQVTGIIASAINQKGINGIAPTAKVFPIKITSKKWCIRLIPPGITCGEPTGSVAAAFIYATDAGVDVINLSGYSKKYPEPCYVYSWRDDPYYAAIQYAVEKGVVIIAAVGNDREDAVRYVPSCFKEVLGVGATDRQDQRPSFSNFSDQESALSVAAPGVKIYTTAVESKYDFVSGTSLAAPFVSGLAALMKQIDPSLSPQEVQEILRDTADEVSVNTPAGSQTWKRINAYKAVKKLLRTDVARLSISIDPNPVPFNTSPQRTLGWNFKATIQETRGIGVRLTGLLNNYYDVNGRLVATLKSPESFFLRLFETTRIPPGGSIEADLWQPPWSQVNLASHEMIIYGIDANGNEIEAKTVIHFQENVTRGLKIEFDPSPAGFDGRNWQSVMVISETNGIGVELTGASFGYYDEQGVALPPSVVKGRDFLVRIFGLTHVLAGGEIAGLISIPYRPEARSMAWSIVGIDDNGHSVYGAIGLPLEPPGSITISSHDSLTQPLPLLPQAVGLTQ